MAKQVYFDVGYYEYEDRGPVPMTPQIRFVPQSPVIDQLAKTGDLVGVRYYLHPKLGNCYRYKYRWNGGPWWLDVTFDGKGLQIWKADGQSFTETAPEPDAGGSDDDAGAGEG